MIVECPYCVTRFRLDEKRVTHPRTMLKCSRCQHIFPLPGKTASPRRPEAVEEPAPPPPEPVHDVPAKARPAQNLSFSFADDADDDWKAQDLEEAELADEEQFSLTAPEPEPARTRSHPARAVAKKSVPARNPRPRDEDVEAKQDEQDEDDAAPPRRGITLRPVFFFLFLVVTSYAVLAGTLYANPEWAEELGQSMPFVGSGARDRLLSRKVVLADVKGGYERLKEGKAVFVVTGQAVNYAAVALGNVQVLVRIYDAGGSPLAERRIYCGSAIPLKLIRDLTLGEVSIIGRLKPPKTFLVRPGEKSPFVAVFTDLPADVAEFTTQVVAAQRQA